MAQAQAQDAFNTTTTTITTFHGEPEPPAAGTTSASTEFEVTDIPADAFDIPGDPTLREISAAEPIVPPTFPPFPKRGEIYSDLNEISVSNSNRRGKPKDGSALFIQAQQSHSEANRLAGEGKFQEAVAESERCFKFFPYLEDNKTALSANCLALARNIKNKDRVRAQQLLRRAIFVDPQNADAFELLDELIKVDGRNRNTLEVRQQAAEQFDSAKDAEAAVVERLKCVGISPSGKNFYLLGKAYEKAKCDLETYNALKDAVKEGTDLDKSELAECHLRLARILTEAANRAADRNCRELNLLRLRNASVEYRRAVSFDPQNTQAIDEFIKVARELESATPAFDNNLMLGSAYLLRWDFDHAKQCYDELAEEFANHPKVNKAQEAFAFACAKTGKASALIQAECLEQAEERTKEKDVNARWWYILGKLRSRNGDLAGALQAFTKAQQSKDLHLPADLKECIQHCSATAKK